MSRWRDPVVVALSCFLLTAVVSGPAVAGVDLTPEDRSSDAAESTFTGATGTLTAAEATIPADGYALRAGVTGSGIHKLDAPTTTLTVDTSGPVLVSYTLEIPELSFSTDAFRAVDDADSEELAVGPGNVRVASNRIEADSYRATVELTVREASGTRVLEKRTVTVFVA
ncbi:hypothetical protein [Haloprofundus halophilus]|uniref:hypothetical protein n=1 Tax=Haloprofundus halophilus TaxID=2283527 RepID=UPI001300ADCE|nr:hypothetical protein [Haloprofundus halophilus]